MQDISNNPPQQAAQQAHQEQSSPNAPPVSPFCSLPPELVDNIFSRLAGHDLAAVSATCHALRRRALLEYHWCRYIQQSVPGLTLTSPRPCGSYRELYAALDRFWFLPRYKIWFCDRGLAGRLIVVRYDPRRACIEGYQLLAVNNGSAVEQWHHHHHVIVPEFKPEVKLHLDRPILQLRARDRQEDGGFSTREGANRFADEIPMALDERLAGMFSNLLLTRALSPLAARWRLAQDYPYKNVWPPPAVPAKQHVSGARSNQPSTEPDLPTNDRPRCRAEVSDRIFRVRQWMQLAGTPALQRLAGVGGQAGDQAPEPAGNAQDNAAATGAGGAGVGGGGGFFGGHIGDEITTYATLDPALYTPTPTKPWRGIWVGDYGTHGCEFLLIHQRNDPPATDAELGLVRQESETDEDWDKRRLDARIYRGRLEAIKLTGDPNIPRGEVSFVVHDLGSGGFLGEAADAPFAGVRMYRSWGHIASTGFALHRYTESQLFLISPDRLAHYWVDLDHVTYLERVNIDDFIVS